MPSRISFPQQKNETERIEDRNDSLDEEGDAENKKKEEFEEEHKT